MGRCSAVWIQRDRRWQIRAPAAGAAAQQQLAAAVAAVAGMVVEEAEEAVHMEIRQTVLLLLVVVHQALHSWVTCWLRYTLTGSSRQLLLPPRLAAQQARGVHQQDSQQHTPWSHCSARLQSWGCCWRAPQATFTAWGPGCLMVV